MRGCISGLSHWLDARRAAATRALPAADSPRNSCELRTLAVKLARERLTTAQWTDPRTLTVGIPAHLQVNLFAVILRSSMNHPAYPSFTPVAPSKPARNCNLILWPANSSRLMTT